MADAAMRQDLIQTEIDQRVYELYDEYCHGRIDRREFLQRASVLTVGGLAMAQALLPRYALAQTIARRAATEGFLALAPDGLFPVGGYPGNDDDGRTLPAGLDQGKLRTDMVNSAHTLGADLHAAVPFYGAAAETARVKDIKAALLIHYAENDERVNALWPAYETALKASGVRYEGHFYPGTQHGFHNNSTPRYHEAAAKLAWERTVAFFKKHLA